jgi:GT2 family glycosyltransferase
MAEIATIIPTFRRPKELRDALASVLSQGVDVELIVVDDSPEGSARDVVTSVGSSVITYMPNPAPTGGWPARVRNLGWPKTTAPFLHFLDDDDLVPEGHYKRALHAMKTHPEAGVVFGRISPFGESQTLKFEVQFFQDSAARAARCARFGPKWAFAAEQLFNPPLLVGSASLARREVVERIGGFDPEIRLMEDVDYHARAFRAAGAAFIDETTLHYRITATSLMHGAKDLSEVNRSYDHMHARYRDTWGVSDFTALKLFARTVLKVA